MAEEKEKLNPKQELFCKMYTSLEREMFGNGVESYLEVYDVDRSKGNWYKTACSNASRLLSNDKVCERINDLLEEQGFNDENVLKQHLFLLNQHTDLKTKMKAIESFYKLTGKNKEPENKIVVQPIINLDPNALQRNNSDKEDNSTKEEN